MKETEVEIVKIDLQFLNNLGDFLYEFPGKFGNLGHNFFGLEAGLANIGDVIGVLIDHHIFVADLISQAA